MQDELNGGSLAQNLFSDSMAEEIEKALDEVRMEAGLQPLPPPGSANEQDLNNRRILFVAIARGVIRHLGKHQDAFEIKFDVGNINYTLHPDIKVKP